MKKKNKASEDWEQGWLAASFMSTATTLGIVPKQVAPGDDDKAEEEVTSLIDSILLSCGIMSEITSAVLSPQPPSSRWRYIGVVRTEFGPASCMLQAGSPELLLGQAVIWANHFKLKYESAIRMMARLDEIGLLGNTKPKRKIKRGKAK